MGSKVSQETLNEGDAVPVRPRDLARKVTVGAAAAALVFAGFAGLMAGHAPTASVASVAVQSSNVSTHSQFAGAGHPLPLTGAKNVAVASSSTKPAWLRQMRSILNDVGGKSVALVSYNGNCGGVHAAACSSVGVIHVSRSISGWSYNRKRWAMAHELAHQQQFKVWWTLMKSPTYHSLFYGSIEFLANCQTQARGLNYSAMHCSYVQVSWAAKVSRGVVSH